MENKPYINKPDISKYFTLEWSDNGLDLTGKHLLVTSTYRDEHGRPWITTANEA